MTLKEALDSGYCSLEDDIDFDDTPQGEKIACLKLEIERLNNIINKLENELYKFYAYEGYNDEQIKDKIKELKGSDKE